MRFDVILWCDSWVAMETLDGMYDSYSDALVECNRRNFSVHPSRRWGQGPKFKIGQRVMVRYVFPGSLGSPHFLGTADKIEEIEGLPNGEFNYTLANGCYVNEYMLEDAPPEKEQPHTKASRAITFED